MRLFNRSIWLVMGILFIITGVLSIWNPSFVMVSLVFLAGCIFIFSGVGNIIFYLSANSYVFAPAWFLADGIISVLLGTFLFFHHEAAATALSYIIGMWLIFAGVSNLIKSFDLCQFHVSGWGLVTLAGILEAGLGFASLWHPFVAMLAASSLIGYCFIFQGIIFVLLWWFILRYIDKNSMSIFY